MRTFPGRRLLELLLAMPWAIPATAIAIGLASTFNRNDVLGGRVLLIGTFWILPLAYFIRGVPLVASAVESSLRQLDASLEDAARGLVDAEFPGPFGGYKPGDEPFFRSVALPYTLGMPTYLDLSFSDAQMAPWPQIVAAMGKRIT